MMIRLPRERKPNRTANVSLICADFLIEHYRLAIECGDKYGRS